MTDQVCVRMIRLSLERSGGSAPLQSLGGSVFAQQPQLAQYIRLEYGSFKMFVTKRSEFFLDSKQVVRLSKSTKQKKPRAQARGPARAEKHKKVQGGQRSVLSIESIPPFPDAVGVWVERDQFHGRKSFGWFQCIGCTKTWQSAHAFKEYKQGCQKCEKYSLPTFLWENQAAKMGKDQQVAKTEAPHDRARCQACQYGECDLSSSKYID